MRWTSRSAAISDYPAVVRRGDLQIAISTNGHSPVPAQRLRLELEQRFGEDYVRGCAGWERCGSCYSEGGGSAAPKAGASSHCQPGGLRALCECAATPLRRAPVTGKVFLVGAGPGDPELLDGKSRAPAPPSGCGPAYALVSQDVLASIRPGAQVIDIGKRRGHKLLTQEEINALLVHFAAQAELVVRLKRRRPSGLWTAGE